MSSSCIRKNFGCCLKKKYSPEEREMELRSKSIDRCLEKEKRELKRLVKLLLLGAAESGKSTFLKQMKIIHGHDFNRPDIEEYRSIIYLNLIKGMKVLIDARRKLNIKWENSDNELFAEHIFMFEHNNNKQLTYDTFCQYIDSLKILWSDTGIRLAFERRNEYQISDSVRYFLNSIERIAAVDYVPSTQDILHARKATKGICEYNVTINNIPFKFVDVGGQRSQRQKWFQCFDSVTSILFLVSSSEYDQVLLEDRQTNRLIESLNIFDTIVNNRIFTDVSMILFLNKADLLEEKLNHLRYLYKKFHLKVKCIDNSQLKISSPTSSSPLSSNSLSSPSSNSMVNVKLNVSLNELPNLAKKSFNYSKQNNENVNENELEYTYIPTIMDYFNDFNGDPFSMQDVQAYLYQMFDSVRRERRKPMYHHFTTAVDTENIKYVFNAVRNTILQKNITALMLD